MALWGLVVVASLYMHATALEGVCSVEERDRRLGEVDQAGTHRASNTSLSATMAATLGGAHRGPWQISSGSSLGRHPCRFPGDSYVRRDSVDVACGRRRCGIARPGAWAMRDFDFGLTIRRGPEAWGAADDVQNRYGAGYLRLQDNVFRCGPEVKFLSAHRRCSYPSSYPSRKRPPRWMASRARCGRSGVRCSTNYHQVEVL